MNDMPLDPFFLNEFTGDFTVDGIDLRDKVRLAAVASGLAAKISRTSVNRQELTRQLQDFLRRGRPDILEALSNAGDVDWNWDDESRGALKMILETFLAELNA